FHNFFLRNLVAAILFVPAQLEQARNAPLYSIRIGPRERTRSPYKSSKCATRPFCPCVSITLPAVSLATRPSGHDGIEPAKHVKNTSRAPASQCSPAPRYVHWASHSELYLTSFRGISRTNSPFAQP